MIRYSLSEDLFRDIMSLESLFKLCFAFLTLKTKAISTSAYDSYTDSLSKKKADISEAWGLLTLTHDPPRVVIGCLSLFLLGTQQQCTLLYVPSELHGLVPQ